MNWLNIIRYVSSTSISFSMISLCSDTMPNTMKKILVGTFILLILAIILTILTTLILISSGFCEYFQPKVIKCSPGNDSEKITTTIMPLLPVPPLEIMDSIDFLSIFRGKRLPKQTIRDLPNVPCSRKMFLEYSLIFGGFGVPLFKQEQGR